MTDLIVAIVILTVLLLKTILHILGKRLLPNIYANFALSILLFGSLTFYTAKYIAPIVASPMYSIFFGPDSIQTFEIKNDTPYPEKVIAYGRKYASDDWTIAKPQDARLTFSNIISLEPYGTHTLELPAGANAFDYLAISRLTGFDFKHDPFRAKIFKVPSVPYVVYTSEIFHPLKSEKITPLLADLFLAYFFCILSVLALIYSFISLKFQSIKRILHYSIGGILALALLYVMYFLVIDIWYFL